MSFGTRGFKSHLRRYIRGDVIRIHILDQKQHQRNNRLYRWCGARSMAAVYGEINIKESVKD